MRVRVKICGITCVADALAAVEAGADAIGLNFAQGPRRITPDLGQQIVGALPTFVMPVALFIDAETSTIQEVCRHCGIATVQLHGDEGPEQAEALFPWRVIKAFRVAGEDDLAEIAAFRDACDESAQPAAILLDTRVAGMKGGTGRAFDWNLAARARSLGRIVLAGGLEPENVAEAIRVARPYAVDACTRLESQPGRKDHARMAAFVAAVRAAEREPPASKEPRTEGEESL